MIIMQIGILTRPYNNFYETEAALFQISAFCCPLLFVAKCAISQVQISLVWA